MLDDSLSNGQPRFRASPVWTRVRDRRAVPLVTPAIAGAHLRTGTVAVDYRASSYRRDAAAFSARVYQSDRAIAISVIPATRSSFSAISASPFCGLTRQARRERGLADVCQRGVLSKGDFVSRADGRLAASTGTPLRRLARRSRARPACRRDPRRPLVGAARRRRASAAGSKASSFASVAHDLALGGCRARSSGHPRAALHPPPARASHRDGHLRVGGMRCGGAHRARFRTRHLRVAGDVDCGLDELVFVAVGFGVLAWGARSTRAPAAIGLGVLSAAVGISKGAVFFHPVVLSSFPGAARLSSRSRRRRLHRAVLGGASLSIPAGCAASRASISRSQRTLRGLSGAAG